MREWVISHFPQHDVYLEVFGGSASVLLDKPPVEIEIYNDLNPEVSNFWRAVQEHPQKLRRSLKALKMNEETFKAFRALWPDARPTDPVERATAWFYVLIGSYSGKWGQWGIDTRDQHETELAWERLPDEAPFRLSMQRFKKVEVCNQDFEAVIRQALEKHRGKKILIYCDPPYFGSEGFYETEDSGNTSKKDRKEASRKKWLEFHQRLAGLASELNAERGQMIAISYADQRSKAERARPDALKLWQLYPPDRWRLDCRVTQLRTMNASRDPDWDMPMLDMLWMNYPESWQRDVPISSLMNRSGSANG